MAFNSVTYTIALIQHGESAPARTDAALPLTQELLEAAGRRYGFGFRWRHWRDGSASETLGRSDAILLGDDAAAPLARGGLRALAPDVWRPPVIAPERGDLAALIHAGGRLLRQLGQQPAALALEQALDKALARFDGAAAGQCERQLGAAILTAL